MTPSKLLNLKSRLLVLEESLAVLKFSEAPGEDFAPAYKKDPERFKKLLMLQARLERKVKKFLKEQAERAATAYRLGQFNDLVQAAESKHPFFTTEKVALALILLPLFKAIYDIGTESAQEEVKIPSPISSKDAKFAKSLENYTLKLSGELSKTTEDRIAKAIQFGVQNNQTTDQIADRIFSDVNDQYRATMIAHTETVKVNTLGRIDVGKAIGAKYKRWQAIQTKVDEICYQLNGSVVPIDEEFEGGFDGPPAHVWCRCALHLEMEGEPTQIHPESTGEIDRSEVGRQVYENMSGSNVQSELQFAIGRNHPDVKGVPPQEKTEKFLKKHFDKLVAENVAIKDLRFRPDMYNKETDYIQLLRKTQKGPPSDWTVKLYMDRLKQTEAPPIITKGKEVLDGLHRTEAYIRSGRKTIPAIDITPFLKIPFK